MACRLRHWGARQCWGLHYPQLDPKPSRTYIHTYTHIHSYTHTDTYTYTDTYTFIHSYILTFVHSCIHTFIHNTYIHSFVHTCKRAQTHTHTSAATCCQTSLGLIFSAKQNESLSAHIAKSSDLSWTSPQGLDGPPLLNKSQTCSPEAMEPDPQKTEETEPQRPPDKRQRLGELSPLCSK